MQRGLDQALMAWSLLSDMRLGLDTGSRVHGALRRFGFQTGSKFHGL